MTRPVGHGRLVDVGDWTRLTEVDAYAEFRHISRRQAVRDLVNHALSDPDVMPDSVRSRALARSSHKARTR